MPSGLRTRPRSPGSTVGTGPARRRCAPPPICGATPQTDGYGGPFHNFPCPAGPGPDPLDPRAGLAGIGPDQLQARTAALQSVPDPLGTLSVLQVCRMDPLGPEQAYGVH